MARTQAQLYIDLKAKYSFGPVPEDKSKSWPDWLLIASIDGIDFYTPNDEEWGSIVAISEEHKLFHSTGFYEMDDMASERYNDYKQVVYKGRIVCAFETPEFA